MLLSLVVPAFASLCPPEAPAATDLGAVVHALESAGVELGVGSVKEPSVEDESIGLSYTSARKTVGDDTAQVTVEGPGVDVRADLGLYENEATGKEHVSVMLGAKANAARVKGTYGEDDNNVTVKAGWSWGFLIGRQVTDRDQDGMPEVTTYSKLGPLGIEATTEMIREVVPEERYHELAREAADETNDAYGWWPSEEKARSYRQTLSDKLEAEAALILGR